MHAGTEQSMESQKYDIDYMARLTFPSRAIEQSSMNFKALNDSPIVKQSIVEPRSCSTAAVIAHCSKKLSIHEKRSEFFLNFHNFQPVHLQA